MRPRLTIVFLFPALLIASPAFAVDPGVSPQGIPNKPVEGPTLLVFEVAAGDGVSKDVADMLTEIVVDESSKLKKFRVVGRADLEKTLSAEQKKRLQACADVECVASIVGAAGIDYCLDGVAAQLGDGFFVTLTLTDARRAAVLKNGTRKAASEVDLANVVGAVAVELLGSAVANPPVVTGREEPKPKPAEQPLTAKPTAAARKPAETPKPADRGGFHNKPATVEKPAKPSGAELGHGLGHYGQPSLTVRGYMNDGFDGGAFDVAFGYPPADWFEPSLGVGTGQYLLLKPRAVFFVYNWAGALKPFVVVQSSINFSSPVAGALGGGVGLQYDFSRNFGVLAEVPVEHFFDTPADREPTVLLFSLGIQGRL
ncbi:MAG: hypothetical protein HY897_09730 [Deltaproteobacteria bacterium]|nr:hypothetical protein [Deltaproteobacteria bacterium]